MPAPFPIPVGLRLTQTARIVERAFDEALGAAGGTLPVWLILLNLKVRRPANQRELAEAVGVREATLTHHLNAMDARGLVTRTRDTANRRVQVVVLTEAGEAAFVRLAECAIAFDARLRAGLADADLATLSTLLGRLAANSAPAGSAPAASAAPASAAPAEPAPAASAALAEPVPAEPGQEEAGQQDQAPPWPGWTGWAADRR